MTQKGGKLKPSMQNKMRAQSIIIGLWATAYFDAFIAKKCSVRFHTASFKNPSPRWNRRLAVDELIELLRALARHEHSDVSIAEEAAAALEAAREDAERLDWLAGDALMISGRGEHGKWETPALLVDSTREACTPRDFRAAIDRAREERAALAHGGE